MALTPEQMKDCVRLWRSNGEWLEHVREDDIRGANTQQSILMFEQAFLAALRDQPPRPTSGLVEWQRYMDLWRRRG